MSKSITRAPKKQNKENKKSRWLHTGGFLLTQSQSIERTTTNEFNRIDDSRQIGGETMTGYTYQPQTEFNIKDGQRDSKNRYTSLPMPALPCPFCRHGDSHFRLFHDGVIATLFYDRQCKMWTVRFLGTSIEALQFSRDEPAMDMRRIIIEEIDRTSPDRIPF